MTAVRGAVLVVLVLAFMVVPVQAQLNPDLASPNIVINLPSRTLDYFSGNTLIKEYPIAIGKPSTPTPLGSYSVTNKEVNPAWYPPRTGKVVPSGPDNPLGYRWMGFLPMYGIHGTNAPWAIGMAVSNGCIRMNEEDVEELFEVVPYGTPVRVTYDRVKVRVNSEGQVSVGVYPDVYGYGSVSLTDVKNQLSAYGLNGIVSDDRLRELIDEEGDRQIIVAEMHKLRVNGQIMADTAIYQKDVLYVPVWTVAGALQRSLVWDEQNQTVRVGSFSVPSVVKGDVLYVNANDIQVLFGGHQVWNQAEKTLDVNILTLALNGKPIAGDVRVLDGVLAVPVKVLADALGQKVSWDADKKVVMMGNKPLPTGMIGDQAYIQITKVYDYFKAYVYWNEPARCIELTHPFKVKGGND